MSKTRIDHPEKIGIGTWDYNKQGTALSDVENMGFGWYYNWQTKPLWDNPNDATSPNVDFVPITWGKGDVSKTILEQIKASGENTLLTFNEPDNRSQSNLSVDEALALWPTLMNSGMRLGSPATTTEQTLGEHSWLNKFMQGVETKGYNVDFMAVHYYSDNPDVGAFKDFLAKVYDTYKLPIWVTEWALVDWANPDRFLLSDTAKFASEAIQMLDDLDYVEQHAWFGAYEGGDKWYINTQLFDDAGHLTAVGDVFADLLNERDPPIDGFDAQYYLRANPDVARAEVDPLLHFNTFGWHEGRDPNTLFDTTGYLANYQDVADAGVNPLLHYNVFGWKEGRDPSIEFDTTEYLRQNPDVAAAQVDPLQHFLQFGAYENRSALGDGMWG